MSVRSTMEAAVTTVLLFLEEELSAPAQKDTSSRKTTKRVKSWTTVPPTRGARKCVSSTNTWSSAPVTRAGHWVQTGKAAPAWVSRYRQPWKQTPKHLEKCNERIPFILHIDFKC